ncbi:hypothetical protein QCE63_11330 [Caballeronia sp. LZ065]|uniref:DUF6600 domain-containing protein n=1 Tax=Caballeronia sp. LZ065 TaxID=3038571 RepID=UPI0028623D52|nr:DUF6600 domain-containing protein [Caballeronia sp. LZ065]MDR5780010.1 hypothetical protein [Caballeronia sp. LZ065]
MKTRTIAAATLAACVLLSQPGISAFAQTPSVAAAPQSDSGDPPGRIARLNYMAGTVTTEPAGASDWSYAQINRPLTTGDQLWNDENARSELHVGSTAVRLGSSTALAVLALDDNTAQLKIAQGTLSTRVREVPPGSNYEIDTPNLALSVTTPGDLRVDVAPDGRATTVTVRSGGVTVYGDGGAVQLGGGQQITFEGTSLTQTAANAAPAPDAFDQWAAGRDAAEDRSISARYVSRDMPGYQDLDANGTWRTDPSYGPVWVPNAVSADWAPYRQGHWAWQDPWGWTWIDDAPWGFAPYHYGRWAFVGSQWAWVPGPDAVAAPPAYAPALVGFVGDGDSGVDWNVALTVGGVAAAGLAWFPLGPGESWHPHRDGWSPRYYERVNRHVYVDRSVHINNTYINYRERRGLTAAPANIFVRGQPVGRQPYAVDPARLRNPHFFAGAPGIAPTRDSFAPGARRADYRPPQGGYTRPVVATRAPVAPPAFQGRFPQHGVAQAAAPRNEPVHLVATHGPARQVIADGAAFNAAHAINAPNAAHVPNATNAPPPGAPQRPGFAAAPGVGPLAQPHGNGVPHPPQQAQFGAAPHGSRGDVAPGHPVMNAPHAPTPQQAQVAAPHAPQVYRGAPQAPMQPQGEFAQHMPTQAQPQPPQAGFAQHIPTQAQPQPPQAGFAQHAPTQAQPQPPQAGFAQHIPQPPQAPVAQHAPQPQPQAYHQPHVEQPHAPTPMPQQQAQRRPEFRPAPQRQPMHQEAHQAPPQMQQPPQQPHPQPQQAQQPQHGGGNDHHRS